METEVEKVLEYLRNANVQDVARKTGIPSGRIYKWLSGHGSPKVNDLNILLNFFRIN